MECRLFLKILLQPQLLLLQEKKDLISPRGKPIDVAETMVSAFSGIKVIKPQIDRSLYYKAAEAKRAIRETTNEFNRLA